MSTVIVTGGAGFLGSRLIERLLAAIDAGELPFAADRLVSLDLAPNRNEDPRVESVVGDLADPALLAQVVGPDTVAIYHLAAVLSGGSEEDFDLAMRVNVEATTRLLEAARRSGSAPRFVFTSSLAVFGGPMPPLVPETLAAQPESSYGAMKAMGELLVNEYSRKGWIDARICRLPTISVRPGAPNSAASSFASGIIREPLLGLTSNCPVPLDTQMWLSSPRTVIENLLHAVAIDPALLGAWRVMNVPGISVSVGEMLAALERVGGADARALVTTEPEERVIDIVCSWPGAFDVERTRALGFRADVDFDTAVREFRDEFAPQR
ncbi:D-erythronate dehydrogenase [Leucobacter sp. PH1c]|uniref:D-erythronate dehydrogenase n=1 Tax=Leucobacter sp. PH1c TaxID=1397278 RepID=UPI00046B027E|nr:D-erythronate dehydrogenase [Leucobacter sp. PH1c]